MAIAVVQKSSVTAGANIASGGTMNVSLTGVVAGNALVLGVAYTGTAGATAIPSNVSGGGSWGNPTGGGDSSGINNRTSISWYSAPNVAGGSVTTTISVPGSDTGVYLNAILYEISGAATSSINDTAGNANAGGNSTGAVTCTGTTLANSGDIAFVGFAVNDNGNTGLSTPASWTSDGLDMTAFPAYGFAHYLPGATTALSPSYGSMSVGDNWGIAMAAYAPAAGGGAGTVGGRQNNLTGTRAGTRQAA